MWNPIDQDSRAIVMEKKEKLEGKLQPEHRAAKAGFGWLSFTVRVFYVKDREDQMSFFKGSLPIHYAKDPIKCCCLRSVSYGNLVNPSYSYLGKNKISGTTQTERSAQIIPPPKKVCCKETVFFFNRDKLFQTTNWKNKFL